MNIKFGTDNFYVRYLKRFLNNKLQLNSAVLGKFERRDLANLIKYLNLPNVEDMTVVLTKMEQEFPMLKSSFISQMKDDKIIWTSRYISTDISKFITADISQLKQYCYSMGWILKDIYNWVDTSKDLNNDGIIDSKDRAILQKIVQNKYTDEYDEVTKYKADMDLNGTVDDKDLIVFDSYVQTGRLKITIEKSNRKNYFPNKDMLVFINQFTGTFMYNYTIRDEGNLIDGVDDLPHEDSTGLHKIAIYECQPGQKITIAHNNNEATKLIIGSSSATLRQNITNIMLNNVQVVTLKPGEGFQYTTSSLKDGTGYNAHYVCIQCPSDYSNLSGNGTSTLTLDTGDINFDGKIDMEDYHLLASYTATGPGSEELHWEPTDKQLAVMNVDETHVGIDVYDAIKLYKFIMGDPAIPSLGISYYTYNSDVEGDLNNVSNLLIIDGHYDESVNIPFDEFVKNDWVIHEKFFNYLLSMSIHKYSNSEDITYLQQLLKEYYPEHIYNSNTFYPGFYSDTVRQLMYQYQHSKVSYTMGDLNRDNKIDEADLVLLRNYLDDENVINRNTVKQYLDGKIELTKAQIAELDRTGDGRITISDYDAYEKLIDKKYTKTFQMRADVNDDNLITEEDYLYLQNEVEGVTNNLKVYDISFNLGWCDVQTENLLETDFNINGNISEVSK